MSSDVLADDKDYESQLQSLINEISTKVELQDLQAISLIIDRMKEVKEKKLKYDTLVLLQKVKSLASEYNQSLHYSGSVESEKLTGVINMSEQCSKESLACAANGASAATALKRDLSDLQELWERIERREMTPAEFKSLYKRMNSFFSETLSCSEHLTQVFSKIVVSQEYNRLANTALKALETDLHLHKTRLYELVDLSSDIESVGRYHEVEIEFGNSGGLSLVKSDHNQSNSEYPTKEDIDKLLSSFGF